MARLHHLLNRYEYHSKKISPMYNKGDNFYLYINGMFLLAKSASAFLKYFL